MLLATLFALAGTPLPSETATPDPIPAILEAFRSARVVALGENHGHLEFHDLVLELLAAPAAAGVIDDIAVEWGNGLYQGVVDRYVAGGTVPWDSVTMAWRNTIVSPNTVWDAPVYERFFREVRRINAGLPDSVRYRVILADSRVDWANVDSIADLRPYFDRALAMATTIRRESLRQGRRALFLAGGLHVHKVPRVRTNQLGVPNGEITPVAWLELHHPGATYVIQSMGAAERLGLPELAAAGGVAFERVLPGTAIGHIPGNRVTTLTNRDGTPAEVYGTRPFSDLVDAVLLWPPSALTFPDSDPATYQVDWYWEELDRRSRMLRGEPIDPELRAGSPAS